MKHVVIYKEEDRYSSFPHITYLPNGKLGLVFRKASKFSADAAKAGIATHHDPNSSIEMLITDNPLSWPSTSKTVYKTDFGVNDPALTVLRNGTVLLRFVALEILPTEHASRIKEKLFSHRSEHGLVTRVVGNVTMKSVDNGHSWQELSVTDTDPIGASCSRDPILELEDGSLLMPVYTGAPQRADISWVIRSFNQGITWQEPIMIMSDPNGHTSQYHGTNFNETSLLDLGKGEILAIVRGDTTFHTDNETFMPVGGIGELYMARSYDSGLSWSPRKKTGIWGQPGSVMKLKNGNLLTTYGYRKSPYGVRACVSRDSGQTWDIDKEIVIRDDSLIWDVGYPFTIELNDGQLFTVYYISDDSGIRHIQGTLWNL